MEERMIWGKRRKKIVRYLPLTLMALPTVIYFFINNYLPLFGLSIAFKRVNYATGIFESPWTGFDNFKFLFMTSEAWRVTINTIGYNLIFIITTLIGSVFVAILLSEISGKRWQKLYQTSFIIPYMVSMTVVAYVLYAFLNPRLGIIGTTLTDLGLPIVEWYSNPEPWPFILIFTNFWKNIGYSAILYLAAIAGIDYSYYEVSTIEGATRWQKIKYITLPMIVPLMITLTLLNIGRIFYADFGLFYQVPLNSGLLQDVTNVIDTYVYRALITSGDIGRASAAGFYQSIVGAILIIISNSIVRKVSPENSIF